MFKPAGEVAEIKFKHAEEVTWTSSSILETLPGNVRVCWISCLEKLKSAEEVARTSSSMLEKSTGQVQVC